jgi:hypothetical protein
MSQRLLLMAGVAAIAAAVVIGVAGMATSPAGFSTMPWFDASSSQNISLDKAQQAVQSFLDRTGDKELKDGRIAGMLSVNGSTGQVWFHSWHGNFIQSRELGG